MRYLTAASPPVRRILLVESGSRGILELAIPRLRTLFGPAAGFDLLTCYPGQPAALDAVADASTRVWRTQDHGAPETRRQLVKDATSRGATILAIICSQEPVMNRWKWWLVWQMPAKVLIINENADCFWMDTRNARVLKRFVLLRLGISGEGAARMTASLAAFPFTLAYLLLYATVVHGRRAWRRAFATRTP